VADHGRLAYAEAVQHGANPAGLSADVVPVGGVGGAPVAEEVDADDAVRARQLRDERVPAGQRGRGILDQQQGAPGLPSSATRISPLSSLRSRSPAPGPTVVCSAMALSPVIRPRVDS
jgi:hypothetical protein